MAEVLKHYLLACDFDQTLSFNDSGNTLCDLIGISGFQERVAGLAGINLVQQGGELAYLLRHDPEFRGVRREHLVEVGKRIRLKGNLHQFAEILASEISGYFFSLYVISAAPQEVINSALEGIVPPDHIYGTVFDYDANSGEIRSVVRVPAGYGKVAVLQSLESELLISPDRTIYVGDGGSDVHVMLHVNNRDGFTIAVSEARYVTRIAKRTVLSENALSVLVPVLEDTLGWSPTQIRQLFSANGLTLQEWEKARTDWVTIREAPATSASTATFQ